MTTPHSYIINMIADYYLATQSTMRKCAEHFGIGKSTVQNYLHNYLKKINFAKYEKVSALSQLNFSQKHIRGGISTRKKFANQKVSAC